MNFCLRSFFSCRVTLGKLAVFLYISTLLFAKTSDYITLLLTIDDKISKKCLFTLRNEKNDEFPTLFKMWVNISKGRSCNFKFVPDI